MTRLYRLADGVTLAVRCAVRATEWACEEAARRLVVAASNR